MKYKASDITFTTVTVLGIAALIAAAYGGCVTPSRGNYLLHVLVLGLPFIAVVAAVWLLVLLLVRRWNLASIVAIAFVCAIPSIRLICPINFSHDEKSENSFTVMTYNVAGMYPYYKKKPSLAMRKILETNADFVMIQEIPHHLPKGHYETCEALEEDSARIEQQYPYRSQNDDDIVIMSKYPFTTDTIAKPIFGTDSLDSFFGKYHHYVLAFNVTIGKERITLVNIHLNSFGLTDSIRHMLKIENKPGEPGATYATKKGKSNTEILANAFVVRSGQAREVRSWLDHAPANLILCGDFNDTAGSYAYRTLRGNDMNDAFSETGLGPVNTFGKYFMYFKIDHVLYRGCMRAVSSYVDKSVNVSDHYPLVTKFVITNKTK